ncbi:hypothetical protein [Rickettsia endosymbiont of Orchestes rusci]|uniref:hypothetical protein n=1 Tax=Rickettsia endosymbiont of Orchestes rusci TaxID=3066250 RepID=UPI00313DE08C
MYFKNFVSLFFVILITSGCAKVTSIRHVAGYNNNMVQPKEILILPPQVEVYTLDISSRKERMYNYEDHLEELIRREIPLAIQENGFRVKLLHRRDIRDQKLDNVVSRLRDSYNSAHKTLYTPLLWEESKAFSITQNVGEAAVTLGQQTNSDILLLIDYAQIIKTNGARARDFAMSLIFNNSSVTENADNSVLAVGIVDTKTGNILWTNMSSTSQDLYSCAISNFSSRDKVEIANLHKLIKAILMPLRNKN